MRSQPRYIGRYRILGTLGQGGMGAVLHAMDESRQREVALKVPGSNDPQMLRRLQQECDVLIQLEHHHIVQVYGSGNEPDLPFYLVMEYVDGMTVADLLHQQGGRLEPRRALQIGLAVAEALAYAHRPPLRVVHRDIKPANVMIRQSDGVIKVTDFGIAAVLADGSGQTIIGTPAYMPPEQALGQGVDERSDLYSLGVMLYQMLTGQLPPQWAGAPARAPGAVVNLGLPLEMSDRIDRLVLGLLKPNRQQRAPQQAGAVVEEIQAILTGRPSRRLTRSGGQVVPYQPPLPRASAPIPPVRASAPMAQQWAPIPAPIAPHRAPVPAPAVVPALMARKPPASPKASRALTFALSAVGLQIAEAAIQPAIAASPLLGLVLGITVLSLAVLAVRRGHQALTEIRASRGRLGGRTRARVALGIGYAFLLIALLLVVLVVILSAHPQTKGRG